MNTTTSVEGPGVYAHAYDVPGVYPLTLYHLGADPQVHTLNVVVEFEEEPLIHSIDLQYDFGSGPSGSRSTLFIGPDAGDGAQLAAIVNYTTHDRPFRASRLLWQ